MRRGRGESVPGTREGGRFFAILRRAGRRDPLVWKSANVKSRSKATILLAAAILLTQATIASAAEVVGSVTTVGGQPIPQARVQILNASGKLIATAVSQADGTYAVTKLPPGDYTVRLAGVAGSRPAAAGGSQVEAQLQGGGETINWVVGTNGVALATQQVGLINQPPEVETGLVNAPLPYGAGLTQVGNTAAKFNSQVQAVTTNSAVSGGALPAIAASANPPPPAPPAPSSPSS